MNDFTFQAPTKVVFGKGVENQVGQLCKEQGATKVLVHFGGQSAKKSGLLDRVYASLDKAGIPYVSQGGDALIGLAGKSLSRALGPLLMAALHGAGLALLGLFQQGAVLAL